ncbi:MAG: glycoside hydrolase family 15 protein [Bacteroidales bacterium]|nr:glycoside hydrolase family 15 protein [Bacteroidales bacterium]
MDNLNYGVIGNCRSAALVSQTGSIDWCCLPDFDSPSVFAKLLDYEKGGFFSFQVSDDYIISQSYFLETNILKTLFCSNEGDFEVIDFMPRYKINDVDFFSPAEIYRFIRVVSGRPSFSVNYSPKLNYAKDDVIHKTEKDHILTTSVNNSSDCIYLYSSFKNEEILNQEEIFLTENHFFLLSYNQKLIHIDIDRVYLEYQRTKIYWLNWSNHSKRFTHYNNEIMRSLLVLKTMTYHVTGAVLAALTTSLPETIGEVRNWDYRFCWLRDASMSIDTLLKMGHFSGAERFLKFITGILKSKHDTFQIMYGIRGERDLIEEDLDHLSGYKNSKPVRTGNAAYHQKQNDVFGYMLNVIHQNYQHFPGTLDEIEDMWAVVLNVTQTVANDWEQPDQGIWEIRGTEKHFVLSKVMSWVAMDRASLIAELLQKMDYSAKWRTIADLIKEDILKFGWNDELQTFTQTYSNTHVDASLLLMIEYGFIEPTDERFVQTVSAIKRDLFHDGLMYRYVTDDDFGKPTSSFTICTFWLIQALFKIGEVEEARSIFENLLKCGNHVGLFSEDIDFKNKRLLGNFPQAYSHLALINTATLFSEERFISKFIKP